MSPSDGLESALRLRGGRLPALRTAPFAGRIGGNQEFIAATDDESAEAIRKKQPDAAPGMSLAESLDPRGFLVADTWRQAVIECWGTSLLIFVLGAAANGTVVAGVSPFAATLYSALVSWIGLTLFIYSAAPVSGGHLNPSITAATFFAGLSTMPRTVLYISAQCIGGIIGAYWLKLGVGTKNFFPGGIIPGCTVDPTEVSIGQLFVLEFVFAQVELFTAFGVGLEPRQAKVFGAALSPILVGLTLGVGLLASGFITPGYTGLSFNSARCLGLMVAKGKLQYHWVHWLATWSACIVNGFFYYFIPPYRRETPLFSNIWRKRQ